MPTTNLQKNDCSSDRLYEQFKYEFTKSIFNETVLSLFIKIDKSISLSFGNYFSFLST